MRGQASATSSVKFGSGWVPAALIDTLGPSFQSQLDGKDNKSDAGGKTQEYGTAALPTKRRFWMFGPEGFREAPKDHRLVIVMGASPEAFFGAIDRALGIVADVRQGSRQSTDLERELFVDLLNSKRERERYTDLLLDLATSN